MKYVKSISLFFVFPILCLALGLLMGKAFQEIKIRTDEEQRVENNIHASVPPVIINDEEDTHVGEGNTILQEQNVMNPSAIAQQEATVDSGDAAKNMDKAYYVALYNNYVVVYHSDRSTIFLFTDIKSGELPADVQEELAVGIKMDNEGELYDFLENYTS